MKCAEKERETCNVEKMTCKGCHYSREVSINDLEKEIAEKLDDEQWKNWQEVLKYIVELQEENKSIKEIELEHQRINGELRKRVKDLEESSNYNWEQYQDIGKMYFALKEKIEDKIEKCNRLVGNLNFGEWHYKKEILQELLKEEKE